MAKNKYIALLTEGELEPEIDNVLIHCGYKLVRATNFGSCITNHYEKKSEAENIKIAEDNT